MKTQAADEKFVLDAVRAWATGTLCPAPPSNPQWMMSADRAGVLATVADALAESGRVLPAELRNSRMSSAVDSMRAMVEIGTLGRALHGLRWVILKGPILADVVYRTPTSRTYDDLDVLVHPLDLGAALEQLEEAEYVHVDRNWPMIASMQRGEISLRGATGTSIDLHWHPINDRAIRAQLPLDLDDLHRRANPVVVNSVEIPSLAPADVVVYVALHASLSGGHRLRWLLDLHQAVRWSGCEPEEIGWRARVHGLGLVVRTMLDRSATDIDPSLARFATAAAPGSPWTLLSRAISRSEPPLPAEGRRSGRSAFAATRRTSFTSEVQLVTSLVRDSRDRANHRDAGAEVHALMSPVDSPGARAAWLADAARSVR